MSKCIRFCSKALKIFLYKFQEMYNNLKFRFSGEIDYFDQFLKLFSSKFISTEVLNVKLL